MHILFQHVAQEFHSSAFLPMKIKWEYECKCSIINDAETPLCRIKQIPRAFNENQIYFDINNLMHGLCHKTFFAQHL